MYMVNHLDICLERTKKNKTGMKRTITRVPRRKVLQPWYTNDRSHIQQNHSENVEWRWKLTLKSFQCVTFFFQCSFSDLEKQRKMFHWDYQCCSLCKYCLKWFPCFLYFFFQCAKMFSVIFTVLHWQNDSTIIPV